ncbi:hypothetical protein ABW20_dc0107519 [Dactylellina cionopaga]|nr:hypothetical protein ABW20_dc0107519 [Dactylellina cionopaga]
MGNSTSDAPGSPRHFGMAARKPYQFPGEEPLPEGEEDKFRKLAEFDTMFVIDDSTSMKDHWKHTTEALFKIAPLTAHYDTDGIDICFFNHQGYYKDLTTGDQVMEVFSQVKPNTPYTPTEAALKSILHSYLSRYQRDRSLRKLNIIVITDGSVSRIRRESYDNDLFTQNANSIIFSPATIPEK